MNDLEQLVYDIARALSWPVMVAAVLGLVWAFIEAGVLLYEAWLRFRFRDLDALEARALKARKAFRDGRPRTAYRYLQENTYSPVVVRFLYDLIRNYQTERLAAKPLKLLEEYELVTLRRLERSRVLARLGPVVGVMGTLIPLAPALVGLGRGDTQTLADRLVTAFSVAVIGLLVGALGYVVTLMRERMYREDLSDMEYLLEILEGEPLRLDSGRRLSRSGVWEPQPSVTYEPVEEDDAAATTELPPAEPPDEPLLPVEPGAAPAAVGGAAEAAGSPAAGDALGLDDPSPAWADDEDPFAALGPVDAAPDGERDGGGPAARPS